MFKIIKNYQFILLILVILTAIFFRFWQIRDYVVFLGDEGRDMIVMRNIFINKRLPFLGPTASVGGFYLGPIYYWMAAPFLFLWRFDPVGPAYFVAIIGVATVFLLYKFLKESLGFWPAILASSLYAIAPLIVRYSRSSWNPNPLPFFALSMFYLIYLGISRKKFWFFLGAGACLGISVQLHYLASILLPLAAIVVFVNADYKTWFRIILFSLTGFLITFSPFLIFEIKHNFPNFRTILEFVTRGSNLGFKTYNIFWLIFDTANIFLEEISRVMETYSTKIIFFVLSAAGLIGLTITKNDKNLRLLFSIGLIWFLGGLLCLRLYTGQIQNYYFGFMFPAPFLVTGLIYYQLWQKKLLIAGALIITGVVIATFINNSFFWMPPNKLIDQTSQIADLVIEKAGEDPYNFALISESNSDHAYRYFLNIKKPPTDLDTQITNQLLVVCESKKCEPQGDPAWEIAGFGRAEISEEQDLKGGIKVFRLIHWPGVPSPAGKPAIKGS